MKRFCAGESILHLLVLTSSTEMEKRMWQRTSCATLTDNKLLALHKSLCHPGVTRMTHFVRSRNLPHSVEEIHAMTANCQTCSMIKPNFHKPSNLHLVKATQPFDRLSIDFKGPLPSSSWNRYLLTIVDEFSRFTFAYPCPNMESKTVNSCLSNLFSIFGMPAYIHSDRGSSFLSQETKTFLHNYRVVTSRTTPYNPEGNGQVERYNGVIWQSILLALKTKNLPESRWEEVLAEALHASHSLLCQQPMLHHMNGYSSLTGAQPLGSPYQRG